MIQISAHLLTTSFRSLVLFEYPARECDPVNYSRLPMCAIQLKLQISRRVRRGDDERYAFCDTLVAGENVDRVDADANPIKFLNAITSSPCVSAHVASQRRRRMSILSFLTYRNDVESRFESAHPLADSFPGEAEAASLCVIGLKHW